MGRPELISTFTKIELWRQTQYRRIVYLDADMVMLRAPHELLRMDTAFAAAPDIGWPDCFNSGVMVLNPNMGDYYALLALAQRGISFDGADQGLLNMHFRDWDRISFAYNCTPSGNYQYVPAYRHFQSSISGVHFIGKDKPWTLGRENQYNHGVYGELLGRWWAVYDAHYRVNSTAYYSGQSVGKPNKVQDYVTGEETRFAPGYSSAEPQTSGAGNDLQQPTPEIVVHRPSDAHQPAVEAPMGDAPSPAERTADSNFVPTPTVQQRKFSAPQVDWRPERYAQCGSIMPHANNITENLHQHIRSLKRLTFLPRSTTSTMTQNSSSHLPRILKHQKTCGTNYHLSRSRRKLRRLSQSSHGRARRQSLLEYSQSRKRQARLQNPKKSQGQSRRHQQRHRQPSSPSLRKHQR